MLVRNGQLPSNDKGIVNLYILRFFFLIMKCNYDQTRNDILLSYTPQGGECTS